MRWFQRWIIEREKRRGSVSLLFTLTGRPFSPTNPPTQHFFEGIWFCILKKILKNLLSLIIVKCRELDSIEARKISIGKALQWLQGSCLVCLQSWIVHFLAAWSLDKWNIVWWWIVRFPDPHFVVSLSGNQTRWLLAACNSLQHLIIDCDDNCENCWLRASKPSSSLIAMIVIIVDCLLPESPLSPYIRKAKKFGGTAFSVKKIAEKVRKSGCHFWVILAHFGSFLGYFGSFLGHLGSYLDHFG